MLDINKNSFIILILSLLQSSVLSAPPTLSGLPDSIQLVESAVGDTTTSLYTLTVSDPDGDSFNCEVPAASGFVVLDIGSGDQVFLASNPGLVGSTTVTLTITCTDANGEQSTGDLNVNILENGTPQISGLPASKTVKEGENTNFDIFPFTVTDPESDHFVCKIDSMTPPNGPFSYQSSPSKIVLNPGHSLDASATPSYTIVVKCEDSYGFSTGILTVLVADNSPPQFTGLPNSVSVPEKDAGARSIYTVTVSDLESNSFVCSISTAPAGSPFYISKPSTQYEIMIPSSPVLSSSTYVITITCTDAYGSSSNSLTVNVVPNSAPTITGLPQTVTISESDPTGTDVYGMTVSDSEGDSFNCQIGNVAPTPSPFVMVPPGTQYKVQLAANHGLEADTTPTFVLTLECTDYTTSSGLLTVVVQSNTPPVITSTPTGTVSVAAGETSSRTLYTLTVTDTDTFYCSMTSSPVGPFSLVYESSNYVIKLNSNPTFSSTSYTLSVTCSDPYGSTTETFQITVSANQPPVITNLPSTVTILETETAAQCLLTLAITDPESETISCLLVSVPSGPFVIQQDQAKPEYKVCLEANAINSLDGQSNPSHTITVNCSDTSDGVDSKVMTVLVTSNNPPVITSLPDIVEVSENEKAERKVWDLTVSDPENDLFVCHLTTVPPNGPFDCRKNSTNSVYTTFLLSTPNLNYSLVPQYELTFTCTDSPKGRSSSNTLTVNVVENRVPTFVNLAGEATPDAMTTKIHDVIFNVDGHDDDVDDNLHLQYSMTVSPSTNSFSINKVSGEISATQDLKYELTSVYIANVTVTDTRKSTSALLNIKLQNVNTAPSISNMVLNGDTHVYFSEFTAAGTNLFTATIDDPDAGQTHTITRYVYPTDQYDMFTLTNNQIDLAAGKSFDYEDIYYYRITLYVSDSYAQTGPYYLIVNVNNEPEVCDFPKRVYEYNTYEAGIGGGNINLNLISTIKDEDNPDTHTYSLIHSAYSKLFNIDSSTGVITFAVDYDIDRTYPPNVTVYPKCTDKFGLTGTATVSLYIRDVNDNEPDFTQQGYVCIVTQYTKKGSHICSINANDIDQDENAEVEYTGSSPTGVGFAAVTKNGRIYATKDINIDSFDKLRFRVEAVDHGHPQLTGTSYVDIFVRETSTFSTTTATYDDWWSEPENIIMVAALALLGLLLLALLFYLCYKYGPTGCLKGIGNPCKNLKCCNRKKSLNIKSPKNPKPEKFKLWDANDLNKTREPYRTGQVESSVPEAMKL